ncbi:MAG: hypothetical protein H0V44_18355 [Planctomycetes bacterium]|nr:hypothetical protein [Planctomycetota bacterium]
MRSLALLMCMALTCLVTRGFAGDAAPNAEKPTVPAAAKSTALSFLTEEEKWVFQPTPGRPDVFYDFEQYLMAVKAIQEPVQDQGTRKVEPGADNPREYAKQSIQHIEDAMSQRNWIEAIRTADIAIRKLQANTEDAEMVKFVATIKGYRDQAQDAQTRDEAQAAFDGLGLKVVGIMWSETGTRLALIAGEPRALGINDRVKDCVIINIDTDRVDFRYHFKRKRFEFPRYVGEDAKSK